MEPSFALCTTTFFKDFKWLYAAGPGPSWLMLSLEIIVFRASDPNLLKKLLALRKKQVELNDLHGGDDPVSGLRRGLQVSANLHHRFQGSHLTVIEVTVGALPISIGWFGIGIDRLLWSVCYGWVLLFLLIDHLRTFVALRIIDDWIKSLMTVVLCGPTAVLSRVIKGAHRFFLKFS